MLEIYHVIIEIAACYVCDIHNRCVERERDITCTDIYGVLDCNWQSHDTGTITDANYSFTGSDNLNCFGVVVDYRVHAIIHRNIHPIRATPDNDSIIVRASPHSRVRIRYLSTYKQRFHNATSYVLDSDRSLHSL